MPFKKTKAGWVYDPEGKFKIQGAAGGLFNRAVDVVRDTLNRPLKWNETLQEWEIDTARWIEESNAGKWRKPG